MIWLLAACAPPVPSEPAPAPVDVDYTIQEVRLFGLDGVLVHLPEVVVTSARTVEGDRFFVQDVGGGLSTGLRVDLIGVQFDVPPPVGSVVDLWGTISQNAEGPVLVLEPDAPDFTDLGRHVEPVPTPWPGSAVGLGYDLVVLPELTVTSAPDPTGRADTSGVLDFGGAFRATPPWAATGVPTGIVYGGRLNARFAEDWNGTGGQPLPVTTITVVRSGDIPGGTPVRLPNVLQATPWSAGGRYVVIQDEDGNGLWVDTEGFDVAGGFGDVGEWVGEVRYQDGIAVLRTWVDPVPVGVDDPVYGQALDEGVVGWWEVSDLGPVDASGDRTAAGGLRLDDRFLPLHDLPDPALVLAAVHLDGEQPVLSVIDAGRP